MRRHAKAPTAGPTQRRGKRPARAKRSALLLFAGALATLAFAATPAGAATGHPFLETFGSAAQPAFTDPTAMAVDPSDGDLLVVDRGTGSIKRYNPDGTPANFSALGTNVIDGSGTGNCATVPADCDETPIGELALPFEQSEIQVAIAPPGSAAGTAGNVYVTGPNQIYIFAPDGHYLGRLNKTGATNFGGVCGVAVDESGTVFVGDYGRGVHRFVPTANPPLNTDYGASFTPVEELCTLVAGAGPSAGSLFVNSWSSGSVYKIASSNGALKYEIGAVNTALSVDPVTGHLYTGKLIFPFPPIKEVVEYDVSGATSARREGSISLAETVFGVAVNGANGHVYVNFSGQPNVRVYATVPLPEVATGAATNITGTGMTLNGTVDPEGEPVTECFFEYGTTTSYGQTAPCAESPASLGSGSSPVPVHADISGLSAETFYHYRLVAANANGPNQGADQAVKTVSLPAVGEEWTVSAVGSEATVKALVNPGSAATTFRVEYGPDTSYGQSTAEVAVGSDSSDHTVTANLTGLTPGTTYHWRVVASNEVGEGEGADRTFTTSAALVPNTNCPNQAFRTGPGAGLPDCRAYEMVSPVEKNNGDIISLTNIAGQRTELNQSSLDGEKYTYSSYKAFGNAVANHYSNQYLATRDATGWHTESISPPLDPVRAGAAGQLSDTSATQARAFTPDLSHAWFYDANKTPYAPGMVADQENFVMRDNLTGAFEGITTATAGDPGEYWSFEGRSKDGSVAVFSTSAALTPDAHTNNGNSQLYESSGGTVSLVSVLPNGEAATNPARAGGAEPSPAAGIEAAHGDVNLSHAVSDDGSRIFWNTFNEGVSSLFVRVDGETSIPIASGFPRPWFQTASTDGSSVLYTQDHKLYRFDVDAETHTLIAENMIGRAFLSDSAVVGASDDLSYVYFVSKDALASGATAGERNFYLDHEGTVTFIAALSEVDVGRPQGEELTGIAGWMPNRHGSRVTPDGRHVAFMSNLSLTGYDNTDASNGQPALEAYVYDADTAQLTCASCNPSGARPVSRQLQRPYWAYDEPWGNVFAAAWIPTSEDALHTPRPLTDDGSRLFFNSYDALLPQDTNGVMDVYQWEAQGSGDCQKAGGCVSLISSGASPKGSEFLEATPNGSDVFFRTASSLVPQDPGLIDVYDARVGGGFPVPPEVPPCIGDSCQSPPAAPNDPTPASAGFRGAGDPQPRKARSNCRARGRQAKAKKAQRQKQKAKRCKRSKRGQGR